MPSKGTPMRHVRVPDELWDEARTVAAEHGHNLSDIIRQALTEYVNNNRGEQMKPVGEDELRVMIALVRKLGGEVELSMKDLMDAYDFELERSDPMSFSGGIRLRVRLAPVTVQGVTVEAGELEA